MEGISLLPVLKTGNKIERPAALCWEHEGNRAVRVDGWKLVAAHGESWQLFDMVHDRTELHNIAKENPERVEELKNAYDAWVKRCGVEEWPIRD